MACDAASRAVSRCPFLQSLAAAHGDEYAIQIACNPFKPATSARRPLLEESEDVRMTFKLFHGNHGLVPLARAQEQQEQQPCAAAERADVHRPAAAPAASRRARPLPLASMSMGLDFFDGVGIRVPHPRQLLSQLPRMCLSASPPRLQGPPVPRREVRGAPSATASLHPSQANFGDFFNKLRSHTQQQRKQGAADRAPKARKPNPNASAGSSQASVSAQQQPSAAAGGTCPLRRILGPMSGLVFDGYGKLQCPEAIIKMRAALAATQPVRELRPQALPVKLLAVGAVSAGVNIPCGAWREHFEKFSPGWFVAIHASIPFIAMLRKAVIMPKFAILYTLATAIAGQTIGSRLERRRLQQERAAAGAAAEEEPGAPAEPRQVAAKAQLQAQQRGRGGGPALLASATLAGGSRRSRLRQQGQQQRRQQELLPAGDGSGWLPCQLEFKQATISDWRAPCLVR
jgi:hypothetical protein